MHVPFIDSSRVVRGKQMMEQKKIQDDIVVHRVNFNQDVSCLVCATDQGFVVFSINPVRQLITRHFAGGLKYVEMLYRTQIFAIIGTGKEEAYPQNKVFIFDDNMGKCIGEISYSRESVLGVRLRRGQIITILQRGVYVYDWGSLRLENRIETFLNPDGICDVGISSMNPVIACPGLSKGSIHLDQRDGKKVTVIPAHQSRIACLALNREGTLVASCSSKGTLIRVFQVNNGRSLRELRRGMDTARILSLTFDPLSHFLACTSDKGTLHLFAIHHSSNKKSIFSLIKGVLPRYFSSEWSMIQAMVSEHSIPRFGELEPQTLYVVTLEDGHTSVTKFSFDPQKNRCTPLTHQSLFRK